jgi:hypothetical protein
VSGPGIAAKPSSLLRDFEITPQTHVDVVYTNVYVSDPDLFDKLWLLAHSAECDTWIYVGLPLEKSGWSWVFLDLQQVRDANGAPIAVTGIDEIDMDLFVAQTATRPMDTLVGTLTPLDIAPTSQRTS